MPTVPTPTMADIQRNDRPKLKKLLDEKAVLGYAFSYSKLHKLMESIADGTVVLSTEEGIQEHLGSCITACDKPTEEAAISAINDKITKIYSENGVSAIRDVDPFGRQVECIYYDSTTGPRLVEKLLIENAPALGISVPKLLNLIKLSKVEKEFSVLSLRGVQDKGEDNGVAKVGNAT